MFEMSKNSGPSHWRSMQELADTDDFRLHLENEFPSGIEVEETGFSRRRFLQIMSASIAMATLAGCRWPEEKIVPFVNRPAGVTPGTPLQFLTIQQQGMLPAEKAQHLILLPEQFQGFKRLQGRWRG